MEFGSFHGGDSDEHNGGGFMETSKIFAMKDAFLFGIMSFDGGCPAWVSCFSPNHPNKGHGDCAAAGI